MLRCVAADRAGEFGHELFRRAIAERDERAWAAIYAHYLLNRLERSHDLRRIYQEQRAA